MTESERSTGSDLPEGEVLKASSPGAGQLEVGMPVLSVDGESIGTVKQLRDDAFLVNRPLARDLWVPFSYVLSAQERGGAFDAAPSRPAEIRLTVSAAHIDSQGWEHA